MSIVGRSLMYLMFEWFWYPLFWFRFISVYFRNRCKKNQCYVHRNTFQYVKKWCKSVYNKSFFTQPSILLLLSWVQSSSSVFANGGDYGSFTDTIERAHAHNIILWFICTLKKEEKMSSRMECLCRGWHCPSITDASLSQGVHYRSGRNVSLSRNELICLDLNWLSIGVVVRFKCK